MDKIKNWVVKSTSNGQEYIDSKTLKEGPKSRTVAVFFRNKHKTSDQYIISLKLSHNEKRDGQLIEKNNSAITLQDDQIDKLVEYIEENYLPLSRGEDSYVSLSDNNLLKVFKQVFNLHLQPDFIVDKLYESGVLDKNLSVAITAAERKNVVCDFERMIEANESESTWQKWFDKNKWILGSEYVKILNERNIDEHHIADYLMQSFDGFLDLVEIKVPSLKFWIGPDAHNNYNPSAELVASISQCLNYLYRIEIKADSVDFQERHSGVKVVKPKCLLVYGRSDNWNQTQNEMFRILNSAYQQINIITYDQLLARAKQLLEVGESCPTDNPDEDLPF